MATLITTLGTGRSGSTMMGLMLANASDAFACGEVHAMFRPWRSHHFNIDYPCDVWKQFEGMPEKKFHRSVADRLNVEYVVDSSKTLTWVIDAQKWATNSGMKVYNLLIWKEPIDLSYSFWKRGQGLMHWQSSFVNYHSKIFEAGLPVISINYSDFVSDPSDRLAKICQVIGMPYFEGKENFWEKESCHMFGSGGIRQQMQGNGSVIAAKTAYKPEFEALIPQVQEAIAADPRIGEILKKLSATDVTNFAGQAEPHKYHAPLVLPSWYYAHRLQRMYKRRFPDKFDPNAGAKVETVPLRDKPAE